MSDATHSDEAKALARVAHLNAILRGIRSVNQLLARERDPEALLRRAAELLVEARGFKAVAIVRTEGDAIVHAFVEGAPATVPALRRLVATGVLPDCLLRAAKDGEHVIRAQPAEACASCAVAREWTLPHNTIAVPIEHERRRLGAILVALGEGSDADAEEHELLHGLASDLALGLRNIELDAELRERDRFQRLVTENVSDVIWVLDLDTSRFTFVSPSVERLRGYTVAEVMAGDMGSALTARSASHLAAVVPERLAAFRRGEAGRYVDEIEQPRKDGTTVWTETTTRYAIDEVTGHVLVYGTSRDIADRRRALEALRSSVERYRSLFENLLDGYAHCRMVTADGVPVDFEYLAVNDAFERLTGLRDAVGKRVSELIPGVHETNPELLRIYGDVARGGPPARFETYVPPLDTWFSVSVFSPAEGEFVAVFDNITARKRAEQALRESEARFRAIFEEAGVGVAQVESRTGRFVHINQQYCDILGRTREEMLEIAWPQITHPDDLAFDRENMDRLLSGEVPAFSLEKRYLRRDGSVVWVHLTASRMWADGEEPTFHVAVVRDVTARKQAEAALLEAQEELRAVTADLEQRVTERTEELARAARAKDEFLASMSHELRTPLNGILGLTEVLGEEVYGPVNDRQRTALARIGESGRHLLSLINDILDVAKVEAGKIVLSLAPVDVAELCHASLRLVQESAQRKRIRMSLSMKGALTRIVADERRLKQVLVNLLTNAVKFTPEGGDAGIDVEQVPGADALRIAVWDTGIGIAPEDLPRLFQPFVQLDSRLSRLHPGTGLGLALVRKLVGLHGGEVSVESGVGRGTRFTLTIPVGGVQALPPTPAGRAMTRTPTPPPGAATGPQRTVLIADDDETNLVTLRDFLEQRGYAVCLARDGQAAVEQARTLRPDLILMDVQMPLLDGLTAMRDIRASSEAGTTPIIALTALAMPGDKERCLAAGADEYLPKPVSLARLVVAMDRLTASRRG